MESKEYKAVPALLNMVFGFIKPMSLICALDLGIADQISSHGQPMTLSQLRSALSIPQSKEPYLRHLLRMLTHFGFIQVQTSDVVAEAQPIYDLTSMSRLVISKQASLNFVPFIRCHLQDLKDALQKSFLCMGDWLKQEDKETPFDMANNCSLWEMTSQNSRLNESFNSAMVSTTSIFTDAIIKSGDEIFKGIRSLVDVGGGVGAVAKAIATNFPYVECSVLDLPHVVRGLANDGIVKFVPGDMFNHIPLADAVLLKFILHDWSDEACLDILKKCKEAIRSAENGGKVIIVDAVVGSPIEYEETQLLFDMLMLTVHAGAERDEHEWKSLFTKAGFSSYRIVRTVGYVSIIEVYP
ncbi:O-methyltransferase [Rhynchospora pubera]|uniref:O-methyltransferase n=1 Tax=Rhynchospora pubera TaxID=906938 RepID=A0AAV8CM84_9POAL|nr:O-methyltransferase [Rhynchospora pubera]KAJ4756959.1 O-methyltransferase [Rhynchospora pubera]KAJ4756965.1 O-methyltransferase [Rhynchospora pubera]KAJ4756975.1 O-methyltransferase [Rhynchospora pubera]